MDSDRYALARTVEVAAWLDLFEAAPPTLRAEHGLAVERVRESPMTCAPGIDHPLLNRAWVDSPDPETLATIAERYRALGVTRFFVHTRARAEDRGSEPADTSGLVRYHRNWVKLAGTIEPVSTRAAPGPVPVRRASRHDAEACGRLYCRGFDIPAAAAPLFAALVQRRAWDVFVVDDADRDLAGVGYLFATGRTGYLAGGVTDPARRGCGIQASLMAARVHAAAAAGCTWMVSETGQDAPTDPQHSLHNMERFGLKQVGVTVNLVPASMHWHHGARAARRARS